MTETARQRRPYAARVPMEERREQLLDAALAVIVRDGFDKVSIDAIAREAGVTRPVVYGAYDGLGALLTALLDRQQVRAFGRLIQALPDDADLSDPVAFVSESVRRLTAMVREDPVTWRPVLLAPEGVPASVQERIEADKERIRGIFAGWIGSLPAVKGGPELDPDVFAHAILAILEHFGRVLLLDPDRFDDERLIGAVTSLFSAIWPSPTRRRDAQA